MQGWRHNSKWEASGTLGTPETQRVLQRVQLPYLAPDVAFLLRRCFHPHSISKPWTVMGFSAPSAKNMPNATSVPAPGRGTYTCCR